MSIKLLAASVLLCLCFQNSYSQDTIQTIRHELISSKVYEINSEEVKYKPFYFLDGPLRTILKLDVYSIKYENGKIDTLNPNWFVSSKDRIISPFEKGEKAAVRYYDNYEGAGSVTLIVSMLSPIVGLIPAITCSSSGPSEKNLNYPNEILMRDTEYRLGYTGKAKKIKQGRVWMNWGIAFGVNIIAYAIILSGK